MLVVSEFVRDVLANEVIEVNKCLDALPPSTTCQDMRAHIINICEIIMSRHDFMQVNDTYINEMLSKMYKDNQYGE